MRRVVSAGAVAVLALVVIGVATSLYATPPATEPPQTNRSGIDTTKPESLYWSASDSHSPCLAYPTTTDRVKEFDDETKTITISDKNAAGVGTVRLVSAEPDICTFTEIFEVTNIAATDFKARTVKHSGKGEVSAVEWFIEQNVSYTVNITDYKVVQVEKEIYNNETGKNETILANETIISRYHDETRYKDAWQDYKPHGAPVLKDTVQRIKVVYHKPPEVGEVSIQTIPMFRGVECDELTWWNTSWGNRRAINIDNTGGSALTYYQVNMDLTSTPINSTSLRVVNETADATVPHWQENPTSGACTDLWFNATSIPASSWLNGTYYIYYGNVDTAISSDIGATFLLGDDFPGSSFDAQWTSVDAQWSVTGGNAVHTVTGAGTWDQLAAATSIVDGVMTAKIKISSDGTNDQLGIFVRSSGTYIDATTIQYISRLNRHDFNQVDWGVGEGTCASAIDWGAWHYMKMIFDGVNIKTSYSTDGSSFTSCKDFTTAHTTEEDIGFRAIQATSYIDWVHVRKCAAAEPTATLGAEEDAHIITSYAPATPLNKNEGDSQTFNATVSEPCQCRWYINGALVETDSTPATEHAYTNPNLVLGANQNFSAVVNTSAASEMQTWDVTVTTSATSKPPAPVLSHTSGGDFWVNFTWVQGAGNITDSYNVSYNGVWDNGTTAASRNETVTGGGWHNIAVCAWNTSGVGTLSATCASDSIEAPTYKPPSPVGIGHTTGNFWVNHSWSAGAGNVTDAYCVLANGVWHNTSAVYHKGTGYAPHGWQNITVWGWNSTAQGTISD